MSSKRNSSAIFDRATANLPLVRLQRQRQERQQLEVASKQKREASLDRIPERWEDFARLTKIRSGTQMISFEPYSFQTSISDLIEQTRGVVIVKPRQHGLTEFIANKFLHYACRFPTYFAAVFSKGQDDTANIARRVRLMAASAGIPLANDSLKDISVQGGGRIVFRTASPNSGRSLESVWHILYDECAFVPGIEQIYGASTPAQSMPEEQGYAKTILLSTPNQRSGLYYETFVSNNEDRDALDMCRQMREERIAPYQEWIDENNWGKAIIHWRAHPIHGKNDNYLQDVRDKQRILESQVQREFNISFDDPVSGDLLFNRFNADVHVLNKQSASILRYTPNTPLHLSLDFNRSPATAGFGQVVGGELRIIYEFYILNSDTFELSDRISRWIINHKHQGSVIVHGDASGNQKTANSRQSNWAIVWESLSRHGIPARKAYKRTNPNLQDSVNSCNYAFEQNQVFLNGQTCPELVLDLSTLKEKNGGIDKSDLARSHAADWFRYMVHDIMPYGSTRRAPRVGKGRIKGLPTG